MTNSRRGLALRSMRQWIGAKLKLHELRRSFVAALDMERRAVARRRPDAATFPAAFGLSIRPSMLLA